MHEHSSEDSHPVMAGNDLCRNRGPLHDKCVATHPLKQKNEEDSDVRVQVAKETNSHHHAPQGRISCLHEPLAQTLIRKYGNYTGRACRHVADGHNWIFSLEMFCKPSGELKA